MPVPASMRHLSDYQRGAMRRKIRVLVDAMTHTIVELTSLARQSASNPKLYYRAFEACFNEFEGLSTAIADYFARFPEERKRHLLGEQAHKLSFLALKSFVETSLRYYVRMGAEEDLPLGIRDHFEMHLRKIAQVRRVINAEHSGESLRGELLEYLTSAETELRNLVQKSTSLATF